MKAPKPYIYFLILLILSFSASAQTTPPAPTAGPTLLTPVEAAALLPQTVFFQGKTAPIQGRNSGGIRLKNNSLVLVSLVDSSGYSSQVPDKDLAFGFTESPI